MFFLTALSEIIGKFFIAFLPYVSEQQTQKKMKTAKYAKVESVRMEYSS